jgi:hypothetical protein
MLQPALSEYEKALGPAHTSTLIIVGNLGNLYFDHGKLKEAREMYKRALEGHVVILSSHDIVSNPFSLCFSKPIANQNAFYVSLHSNLIPLSESILFFQNSVSIPILSLPLPLLAAIPLLSFHRQSSHVSPNTTAIAPPCPGSTTTPLTTKIILSTQNKIGFMMLVR